MIAFRLKTPGLARGTDRANSGGPPRGRVCCRTARYPLPGTYRGAIHVDRNLPAPWGCLQSEPVSSAVHVARGDETITVSLLAQEGQPRSLANAGISRKESFDNSN